MEKANEIPQYEPTYWISYEFKQIYEEIQSLNSKLDTILSKIEKKGKKITLNDVNTKVDCIIESLDKKRKHEE